MLVLLLTVSRGPAAADEYSAPGGARAVPRSGVRHNSYSRYMKMFQTDWDKPPFTEIKFPETYIDPTVNFGLKMVLPERIQERLLLNTGYDRWRGLPVITADYFVPLRASKDRSLFMSQRISLTSKHETFSVGSGVRRIFGQTAMVGMHAFHDWVRRRGEEERFLRNAGVGFELEALPGAYSDLTFNANAYFPLNDRITHSPQRPVLTRECIPVGFDAAMSLKLPAVTKYVDSQLDLQFNSLRGEQIHGRGYKVGLSVDSRDGMWSVAAEHKQDNSTGPSYRVDARVSLAFDWSALWKGEWPFSAPYPASDVRFNRDLQPELKTRVARNHDITVDKTTIEAPQTSWLQGEVLPAKATDTSNPSTALAGKAGGGAQMPSRK